MILTTETFIDIISHFSAYILQIMHKIRDLWVEKSLYLCAYTDHFKLATMWLINYTTETLRILSVDTQRVVTFHA